MHSPLNIQKNVCKVIYPVLHPDSKPLRTNPDKLNGHFISTAARTLGSKAGDVTNFLN